MFSPNSLEERFLNAVGVLQLKCISVYFEPRSSDIIVSQMPKIIFSVLTGIENPV